MSDINYIKAINNYVGRYVDFDNEVNLCQNWCEFSDINGMYISKWEVEGIVQPTYEDIEYSWNNMSSYFLKDPCSSLCSFVEALNSGTQGLSSNTITKVTFPTENIDSKNEFLSNTFTSASNQKVLVIADIGSTGSWRADSKLNIYIYVNGSAKYRKICTTRAYIANVQICAVIELSAGDTIDIYAMKTDGGTDYISGSTLMIAQQF
jgi:hypothetical protein